MAPVGLQAMAITIAEMTSPQSIALILRFSQQQKLGNESFCWKAFNSSLLKLSDSL